MTRMRIRFLASTLALSLPAVVLADHMDGQAKGDIRVEAAYSRAMLPVAKVGGGYLTIVNGGSEDRLVRATSDRAGEVQIHEMKMDGGIMEMRELTDGIAVPAHTTVELKPGSYHLMFMNVDKPFKEGEIVKATLVFEKAGSMDVELAVGPVAGGGKPNASHHGNGAHDHGTHGQ